MVANPQRKSTKPAPRVVSQAEAARTLGVSPATICVWLDARHLEPWFAPNLGGKKRRRMVVMASLEKLIDRGTVK